MDNKELENKIKEIIKIDNFFDMMEAVQAFKKEYKRSDFFKKTHMPLRKVIMSAKFHYTFSATSLWEKAQYVIDNLKLDNVENVLNEISNTFEKENKDIKDILNSNNIQDIINIIKK